MDVVHPFSVNERTKIPESYFSTKSVVLTQRAFWRQFPRRKVPCRKTITNTAEKFRKTGSVGNDNQGNSRQQVTARTPANIQAVREPLQQSS